MAQGDMGQCVVVEFEKNTYLFNLKNLKTHPPLIN